VSFLKKEITMPRFPTRGGRSRSGEHVSAAFRPTRRAGFKAPRRAANVTGLEISATQVIAAEARLQGGQIVAGRVAAQTLPVGLMRDGLIVNPGEVAAQLQDFFGEHRFSRRVRVGLATPRTVLRAIDLPPMQDGDIRSALMMVAQERIPMPLDKAVMDFRSLGIVDTPEGRRLRVIVVVTEREGVDQLLETLRGAKLRPEGVDLSVFAAIRAVGHVRREQGPVLYAQLGDLVNIAIAQDGVCRFTRQAPQGLAMLVERLAELRSIPAERALDVLRLEAGGLAPDAADRESDLAALVSRTAAELGSELRAAAEFYSTQSSTMVTAGLLTGPLAPLPGFADALSRASGLELRCGEVTGAVDAALGGVDPSVAAVACGLAVAEVGP
jgi:type IV pilus assembly protein PilM